MLGTHGVTELVFELTGIDLETTTKDELNKETKDEATSVMSYAKPDVQDRALSAIRFTPEVEPPNPPASPEQESIPEEVIPEIKEVSYSFCISITWDDSPVFVHLGRKKSNVV